MVGDTLVLMAAGRATINIPQGPVFVFCLGNGEPRRLVNSSLSLRLMTCAYGLIAHSQSFGLHPAALFLRNADRKGGRGMCETQLVGSKASELGFLGHGKRGLETLDVFWVGGSFFRKDVRNERASIGRGRAKREKTEREGTIGGRERATRAATNGPSCEESMRLDQLPRALSPQTQPGSARRPRRRGQELVRCAIL